MTYLHLNWWIIWHHFSWNYYLWYTPPLIIDYSVHPLFNFAHVIILIKLQKSSQKFYGIYKLSHVFYIKIKNYDNYELIKGGEKLKGGVYTKRSVQECKWSLNTSKEKQILQALLLLLLIDQGRIAKDRKTLQCPSLRQKSQIINV